MRDLQKQTRWLATALSLFAALLFTALAVEQGPPASPDGPGLERDIQYVFVVVGIVATAMAWRWSLPGGVLLLLTGTVLGVAAAGRYSTQTSFFVALLFILPGVLYLATWSWRRPVAQLASLGLVTAFLVYGGMQASIRHSTAFGPAHPSSMLTAQPDDLIEWVWSGGVTARSAVVKAKLRDPGEKALLAVSTTEDFDSVRFFDARLLAGEIAWFDVTGLQPSTVYYYAVVQADSVDPARRGRFETFPTGPSSFMFAVGSCARTGSNGAVFEAIRAEGPLLYVISGDYHYDNITSNSKSAFAIAYDRSLTAPAQAALYRQTPIAYIWDDHDFGGNNSDASSAAKHAARLSYREFVPHYAMPAGDGNNPIYQAFTVGRVRFVMTDTRSMKNAEKTSTGADSMLGRVQLQWLKNELKTASKTYGLVVWVNAVPWIAPDDSARDDWGGFAAERREIANFIADNRIDNLMMVSGDAHMVAIDDGTNSDYSTSKTAGFPILHAGALDRPGSVKGGPYSEGTVPGAGQYGLVHVTDAGETVTVTLTGKDYLGNELVSYTFSVPPAILGH